MYFKQIRYNAAKNRKDNGLFFGSLVIAIVAFYTLLSLESQDVMRYLKTIEGDAVRKLMLLIPVVYIISLFFVFFLVYFAYRYQLDNRKNEFGLYLMMGLKRSRLFFMLMGETVINSLVSLLIGLPLALLLTEGVSLATLKLVGLGIVRHQITLSLSAVIGTVVGFAAVQFIAMIVLSSSICRKEPLELLDSDAAKKQVSLSRHVGWIGFVISLIMLIAAYIIGVRELRSFNMALILLVLFLGALGTFMFFRSIGSFIGYRIKKKSPSKTGLYTFTGRQIQENVLSEYKALAVSSLLLLMAIACASFGIGVAASSQASTKTADFTIMGTEEDITAFLDSEENASLISQYYPMYLGSMYGGGNEVSWDDFIKAVKTQPESDQRDNIIEDLASRPDPYIISLSSYNELLRSIGKEPIQLAENQAALYTSLVDSAEFGHIMQGALDNGGSIEINNQKRELTTHLYTDNIVADRKITIYLALIIPDADYQQLCDSNEPYCWNVLLKEGIIEEKGLIGAIEALDENLYGSGFEYESYINGIGRSMFYTVAASYLTIYLGVLFMVIANTVIGLKYLMQQRANKRRYLTLLMLGTNIDALCKSAKKQINTFFLLVLGLAVCSSIFAVWAMFDTFSVIPAGTTLIKTVVLGSIAFVLLIIIEMIYSNIVSHSSNKEIRELQVTDERTE